MKTNKLSVLIVNYNSSSWLLNLITSLSKIEKVVKEIVIIDNHSDKANHTLLKEMGKNKKTKICFNDNNLGFSRAVNQGIKICSTDYILLLNPDTMIIDNSIESMYEEIINNPNISVIGGKIYQIFQKNPSYTANTRPLLLTSIFEFTTIKKIIPSNIFSKRFWIESTQKIMNPTDVDALCGAFILFRKRIHGVLNLFDENYFLYLEDLDFGIKNRDLGYRVVFFPSSSIQHQGGASSKSKYRIELKEWYKSRKYFFKKHFGITSLFPICVFILEERLLELYHYIKHESAY